MPVKKQNLTGQTLKIFWQHAWRYKWQVFVVSFGVLIHIILSNTAPVLYKWLIDAAINGSPQNISPLISIVKIILMVAFARLFVARVFNFVNNDFQPKVMADLNNTCFQYLQKHSYNFFSNNFVGSLVTKVKRYERSFETVADQLTFDLGRTFLDLLVVLVVLFYENRTIGAITMIWAILYLIFSYFFSLYKLPTDIKRAAADSTVTARMADTISNNTNVKIFSNYNFENSKFAQITNNQFIIRRRSWNLGTISEVVQSITMVFLEFFVLYLCVKFWQNGQITVGTIALIQGYYFRIFDRFWSIGKNIRASYEAIADANEMTEILNTPLEIKDDKNCKLLLVSNGKIEFKNTTFAYYKEIDVLKSFNLTINPKEKVALIGPSGGGKSTIVKLLLRFLDINAGAIKIDGQEIAKVTQDSLRNAIALVPQDPILFHRSLMDNIRYARAEATHEEVIEAAKSAHAHEFIESFPEKYNTLVGERGIKLSGGERQRVAIARAILKDVPILILDEATSSLDSESELYIQDALKKLMKNKTVIVIAHRLSTIMQMDRIIVLENGKITEQGKHEELLKAEKGTYQRLWQIQAGGFEQGPEEEINQTELINTYKEKSKDSSIQGHKALLS